MHAIVVSAADEQYYSLLKGCLESLRINATGVAFDIGILDLGLSDASAKEIRRTTDNIVVPEWDLQVDASLKLTKPHLRAFFARPYLRKYFPGYEYYIWLDCDTWVQEPFALHWLLHAAARGGIALVPEVDRCYRHSSDHINWCMERLKSYFGENTARLYLTNTYYNSGVFCLHVHAPHWDAWARYHSQGHKNSPELPSDQTALNFAIWIERLPVHALPALCNWCCHLSLPVVDVDRRKLIEPLIPYREIGVIHLAFNTKDLKAQVKHKGRSAEVSLRFNGLLNL
jgi:lipopolysaccharide biosynthesis glycosyltransferase